MPNRGVLSNTVSISENELLFDALLDACRTREQAPSQIELRNALRLLPSDAWKMMDFCGIILTFRLECMERKHIFLVMLSKFCHRPNWSGVKDFRWSSQSSVRGCVHLLEQRHLLRDEPQFHLLLDTHRLRDQIQRRLYMPPFERDMNVQQF